MKEFKIESLSHETSRKTLFNQIDFSIINNEKIGLIGRNGNGKSTFLKVIAEELKPDTVTITKPGDYQIGYLSQDTDLDLNKTVLETVFDGDTPIMKTVRNYEKLLIQLTHDPDKKNLQNLFTKAQQQMDTHEAWNADATAKRILNILGISDMDKKIRKMSGGQQKRVALAQVLIQTPDLLILDEPTNHLDFEMIHWLENYLINYKGALIIVTHDRYFLDRIVDKVIELDYGKLEEYSGNYQQYLEEKAIREEENIAQQYKNKQLYKKELAWMREGVRARGTKQKARIERFEKLKKQVNTSRESFNLNMDLASSRLGNQVFEIEDGNYQIDNKIILDDFSYIVQTHDRIGITGTNGTGKSTLLNILSKKTQLDSGSLIIGETVRVGYFQQDNIDIPADKRIINYLQEVAEEVARKDGTTVNISQLLEQFMFPTSQHGVFIRSLSGGEKRRLYLVRLLMERPNVLLLDEPTNNLDIDTLNVLEEYIDDFPGAVITVSHDRYFLDKVTDKLLVFKGQGEITEHFGTLADYFDKTKPQKDNIEKKEKQEKKVVSKKTNIKTKLNYMEEKEWAGIEDEIINLEENIANINEKIDRAGSDYTEVKTLFSDKVSLQEQLDEKYERWEYLSQFAD